MPDMKGPIGDLDLGAVGNAATVSKKSTAQPTNLVSFSVKRGDNGGVLVCENYEKKTPAGRRSSSFASGTDYKENPFSPDDGAAATSHITDLLGQMGVTAPEPEAEPELPPMRPPGPPAPPPPAAAAMRGPAGGGSFAARGPMGNAMSITKRPGGFGGY